MLCTLLSAVNSEVFASLSLPVRRFDPGPYNFLTGLRRVRVPTRGHTRWRLTARILLTRFIHDHEDTKGLFCYKHVVETVFVRAREAFACLTIAQHSVCCSPIFFSSRPCCSSISGRVVPMAEPCC